MTLSIKYYSIAGIVQATHHQDDVRYGTSSVIQCSCMSLIFVSWTLFKSPGLQDKLYLDYILGNRDKLFKFVGKFRYLGMEDLPQEFLKENSSVNMKFLKSKTGEITAGTYLLSITSFVKSVQKIGTGALLIVNSYIPSIIWRVYFIYHV